MRPSGRQEYPTPTSQISLRSFNEFCETAPWCRAIAIELKFEPVAGKGKIYAYTIMYHAGDKRFAAAVPYASIIVELDDAPGALMAGNLLDAPYTEAKVGRRVEVTFERLTDEISLPQFKLARE